jgi:CDP-diacylglycerol--serine O-phosphatidyltransferase
MGWLIGFLFVISGAMRLARFNIQESVTDRRFFVGLPIPAAAGVVAALVYRFPEPMASQTAALPLLLLVTALSFLMVSKLRYYSFKDFDIKKRHPSLMILFLALVIVAIFTHPQAMLLIMATVYLASGVVLQVWSWFSPPKHSAAPEPAADAKEQ